MSIDPEKLEEAIDRAMERFQYDTVANSAYAGGPHAQQLLLLATAARAHLATLPRYKEVEVEKWAVIDASGGCIGAYDLEKDALTVASGHSEWFPVRLTGTAKVRA